MLYFLLFTKIDNISTSELEAKLKNRSATRCSDAYGIPWSYQKYPNVPLTEIGSYASDKRNTLCHLSTIVRSKLAAEKA